MKENDEPEDPACCTNCSKAARVRAPAHPRTRGTWTLGSTIVHASLKVVVRFVVDSAGRTEPGTIQIVRETHSLFGESVRHWLAGMRYQPAELGGTRVRQLVEQRVEFTLRN